MNLDIARRMWESDPENIEYYENYKRQIVRSNSSDLPVICLDNKCFTPMQRYTYPLKLRTEDAHNPGYHHIRTNEGSDLIIVDDLNSYLEEQDEVVEIMAKNKVIGFEYDHWFRIYLSGLHISLPKHIIEKEGIQESKFKGEDLANLYPSVFNSVKSILFEEWTGVKKTDEIDIWGIHDQGEKWILAMDDGTFLDKGFFFHEWRYALSDIAYDKLTASVFTVTKHNDWFPVYYNDKLANHLYFKNEFKWGTIIEDPMDIKLIMDTYVA